MQGQFNEDSLEIEILAEKATAYFATIRKMEAALEALREFDALPHTGLSSERGRQREQLVGDAAERAWFFVIQREAMKLLIYEELFVEFEIPEEVRRCMGTNTSHPSRTRQ